MSQPRNGSKYPQKSIVNCFFIANRVGSRVAKIRGPIVSKAHFTPIVSNLQPSVQQSIVLIKCTYPT